jgi:hypothetical protein
MMFKCAALSVIADSVRLSIFSLLPGAFQHQQMFFHIDF